MLFNVTLRRAGKMLVILGILWLAVAIGATVTYGSAMTLNLQAGLILYGAGPLVILVGALLWKFGKT